MTWWKLGLAGATVVLCGVFGAAIPLLPELGRDANLLLLKLAAFALGVCLVAAYLGRK